MNYGIALPYTTPRTVAKLSQLAEESGWDGVFLGDAVWCEDPMIGLAVAAMVTNKIRLGTMITPAPLRIPWKLASESVALDHLSNGRLTLGLGAGAVWMGWQAFPDEVTDVKSRAEMLDESIDILTLLYRREPFDFDGKHYNTHGHKLRFPPSEKAQFVTECGISLEVDITGCHVLSAQAGATAAHPALVRGHLEPGPLDATRAQMRRCHCRNAQRRKPAHRRHAGGCAQGQSLRIREPRSIQSVRHRVERQHLQPGPSPTSG